MNTEKYNTEGTAPSRRSQQRCSVKIGVLRNFTKFTGKHLCQGLEIFKDTFLTEQLRVTANVNG